MAAPRLQAQEGNRGRVNPPSHTTIRNPGLLAEVNLLRDAKSIFVSNHFFGPSFNFVHRLNLLSTQPFCNHFIYSSMSGNLNGWVCSPHSLRRSDELLNTPPLALSVCLCALFCITYFYRIFIHSSETFFLSGFGPSGLSV